MDFLFRFIYNIKRFIKRNSDENCCKNERGKVRFFFVPATVHIYCFTHLHKHKQLCISILYNYQIDSKHHKLANYSSNTDNCEHATRLLGQRYDVYSKYHKVGNSFNFLKYTHKNKPVVYQKQTLWLCGMLSSCYWTNF